MRVLHVFDHSVPLQSGYTFRSLGILAGQRGHGIETVHVTTPRYNPGSPPAEIVDGLTFHRTAKPGIRLPILRELAEMRATRRRLRALIAEHRPDIIHAHSPVLCGLPALRAARAAGLPFAYEIRALWEDAAVDHGTAREGDIRYRAQRALESYVMRRADALFTLCQAMRDEIAGRGIDAGKITVIPNAVDLTEFPAPGPRDAGLAAGLGLTGRKVLGFIGSFYGYEGIDLVIEALPAILAEVPGTALLLVGGGYEDARLRAQVEAAGLGHAVHFTGRVPHDEVGKYYRLVDAFIYARRSMRLTELVTPLKPLEAMAQLRLVLASDIGGHRELITDGVTGYLFPPGDAAALARRVIEALRAPDGNAAMLAAGRHFVETERNWAASAARYRPVYERIATARRTGPTRP